MKSRRRGRGAARRLKEASFFSDPGRRRMAKRGSSPRKSPLGRAQQLPGEVQDLRGIRGDDQEAGAARGHSCADLLPGGGQEELEELGSQGGLCAGVHLRAAGLLEEGAEAAGDLPHASLSQGGRGSGW